jgi:hypothetical protein
LNIGHPFLLLCKRAWAALQHGPCQKKMRVEPGV